MKPTPKSVNDVLDAIEQQESYPTRQLARGLVAEYRRGKAIDPKYRFENAPIELRQIIYNNTARFHCRRSLLLRLLGQRGYVRRSFHPEYREVER